MSSITAATKLCASLANPNASTKVPQMYNAAFDELGIDFRYMAFAPESIKQGIEAVRSLGLVGVSVSHPFKEEVIAFLDELDPIASDIGAVNIVHNIDGKLIGYNSDWFGATEALTENISPTECKSVAVLGAGGAARAATYGLKKVGFEVVVFNRSQGKGRRLGNDLGVDFGGELSQVGTYKPDVVLNATSIGRGDNEDIPIPDSVFDSASVAMDIVVKPTDSKFLERAKSYGLVTVSGARMLVLQGALTFKIFTGVEAPIETMYSTVLATLK